jgi:hypothetical protein
MKISKLTKAFAKAVGCIAITGATMTGAAAALPSAAPQTTDMIVGATPPTNTTSTDVYFNLLTPLFPQKRYDGLVKTNELSLDNFAPDIITIEANTPEGAVDQIIQGLKAEIIKNGGALNRILISTDGSTNGLADPLPNASCFMSVGLPVPFCNTKLTDILHAMVDLQNEEFPGHKAGEALGRAIDLGACDVFATNASGFERLPAKEISRLAGELNMPIIATVTEGVYFPNQPRPLTGVFWAMLPNGNVSRLPGPYYDTGENIKANEAWIQEDGFTVQEVQEPVADHPFSFINTIATASNPGPGLAKIASVPKKAPAMG